MATAVTGSIAGSVCARTADVIVGSGALSRRVSTCVALYAWQGTRCQTGRGPEGYFRGAAERIAGVIGVGNLRARRRVTYCDAATSGGCPRVPRMSSSNQEACVPLKVTIGVSHLVGGRGVIGAQSFLAAARSSERAGVGNREYIAVLRATARV